MKYAPCNAYFTMVEWSRAYDAAIYIHEADQQWAMRSDERISYWSGETLSLLDGVTLVRLGGHFPGSAVLHWRDGADGEGILCTGDTIQVVSDRNWVSFMYSFPNIIPLPASEVERIRDTIKAYTFERLYGAWFDRIVAADAHNAVLRSADRYIQALQKRLEP
jgi:glyoxylase-like metal-dependent hydrolase (beta-lactamase superfamily II)